MTNSPVKLVATCQFCPEQDMWRNVSIAKELAFEAATKGASLVVLPELCVVDPNALNDPSEAAMVSQTREGFMTQELIEAISGYPCTLVFGYVELEGDKLYNSALCVNSQGILGNSRKHNLSDSDYLWATPGETLHPVITTNEGRLGILVGRDAMNQYRKSHEFFRDGIPFYRKGSVDTIAHVTNVRTEAYPPIEWMELAEATRASVVVSNQVCESQLVRKGGSCVVDRSLKIWTYGSSFTSEAVVGGVV